MPLEKLAFQALVAELDRLRSKDDVIAHLATSRASINQRQTAYRMWASLAGEAVYRSDLDRVKHARRREAERTLF